MLTNKIIKIGGIVIVLTFIAIAVFLFLQFRQPIPSVSVTEEITVEETKFVLKDISNDPRFANENFTEKFIPTYDINPCLNVYDGGDMNSCPSLLEKEVAPGIKAVIKFKTGESEQKLPYLQFYDQNGQIKNIPEIIGLPAIAYINQKNIILEFEEFESPSSYMFFDGQNWLRSVDLIKKSFGSNLFFSDNDLDVASYIFISPEFIKLIEINYYLGDSFPSDPMNVLRLEALGSYEFLFDRSTLELIDFGYSSKSRLQFEPWSTFLHPRDEKTGEDIKISDDIIAKTQKAVLEYMNWSLNEKSFDPSKEILSWTNYIDFGETKIPYPNNWKAESFYLKTIDENVVGIKFLPPDDRISNQFISLGFPVDFSYRARTRIDISKGLNFEIIKMIHVLQEGLPNYLQKISRENIKITFWDKSFSRSWSFNTNFSFGIPNYWSISGGTECGQGVKCLHLSPWYHESLFYSVNFIRGAPFGVTIREIPNNELAMTISCIDKKCKLYDNTANMVTREYSDTILSSTENFSGLGKPYIVAIDKDNTARYYFKINDQYFLAFTFRGIQDVDKDFIKNLLDRIEIIK